MQDDTSIPVGIITYQFPLRRLRLDRVSIWRAPEQAGAANFFLGAIHRYSLLARVCIGQDPARSIYTLTGTK